jgi:hypothetical protein
MSSTEYAYTSSQSWRVNFSSAAIGGAAKNTAGYVICVKD